MPLPPPSDDHPNSTPDPLPYLRDEDHPPGPLDLLLLQRPPRAGRPAGRRGRRRDRPAPGQDGEPQGLRRCDGLGPPRGDRGTPGAASAPAQRVAGWIGSGLGPALPLEPRAHRRVEPAPPVGGAAGGGLRDGPGRARWRHRQEGPQHAPPAPPRTGQGPPQRDLPPGGRYSTVYFFELQFGEGGGEFQFPGRGAHYEPLVPGNTGLAYTRRDVLLDFKILRV